MYKYYIDTEDNLVSYEIDNNYHGTRFSRPITRSTTFGIPDPKIDNYSNDSNSSDNDPEAYIRYTDGFHNDFFNLLNNIDFPEKNKFNLGSEIYRSLDNYIIGTNDGLLIFRYDKTTVVYDLFMDYDPSDNSKTIIIDDIDIAKDIRDQKYLLENCKETSTRVHKLNIYNGNIVPEIKFIDSNNKYHYFIDMYIPKSVAGLDEYGYYFNKNNPYSIPNNFNSATFLKTSQVLISDTNFENSKINDNMYTTTTDSNLFTITFDSSYSGIAYVCV